MQSVEDETDQAAAQVLALHHQAVACAHSLRVLCLLLCT